ncbi:MAG: DUF177 domain-containing protein [Stellaceae bacterium]
MSAAPEFSRLVQLNRVGWEPYRQETVASEAERDGLARRFGLLSLDRLTAAIELVREPAGTILLTASFEAAFAQECIVTLDPVVGSVAERFQLRYGRPEDEEDAPSGDDDPALDPLIGEAIDIGEAVAQEFSLALPPFPRAADAVIEIDDPETPEEGPFSALDKFRRERSQ